MTRRRSPHSLILSRNHPIWEWGTRDLHAPLETEIMLDIKDEQLDLLAAGVRVAQDWEISASIESFAGVWDCANCDKRVPVINAKFKEQVSGLLQGQVQFVPVAVVSKVEAQRWWIVNILTMIDCVDERMSQKAAGNPVSGLFLDAILESKKIPAGIHVFRAQGFSWPTYISNEFRLLIRRSKLRTSFIEPVRCSDLTC